MGGCVSVGQGGRGPGKGHRGSKAPGWQRRGRTCTTSVEVATAQQRGALEVLSPAPAAAFPVLYQCTHVHSAATQAPFTRPLPPSRAIFRHPWPTALVSYVTRCPAGLRSVDWLAAPGPHPLQLRNQVPHHH